MPSDQPMPLSPMPTEDFTPTMAAHAGKYDGQSEAGIFAGTLTGILGKAAGPLPFG
jgi:hypothetical protein